MILNSFMRYSYRSLLGKSKSFQKLLHNFTCKHTHTRNDAIHHIWNQHEISTNVIKGYRDTRHHIGNSVLNLLTLIIKTRKVYEQYSDNETMDDHSSDKFLSREEAS